MLLRVPCADDAFCVFCSALEGSNQVVSDQGVRKSLYQKVRVMAVAGL